MAVFGLGSSIRRVGVAVATVMTLVMLTTACTPPGQWTDTAPEPAGFMYRAATVMDSSCAAPDACVVVGQSAASVGDGEVWTETAVPDFTYIGFVTCGAPGFCLANPARTSDGAEVPLSRLEGTRWVPAAEPQGSWEAYMQAWPFADVPEGDPLLELVPEVQGLASEVVSLPTFGKWGYALQAVTGPLPHLVLAGVSTDCCVVSTALAAADAGATITVVTDACAGSTPENHDAAIALYFVYYNFCRVHSSLGTTPAVASGLTDHKWSVAELLKKIGM